MKKKATKPIPTMPTACVRYCSTEIPCQTHMQTLQTAFPRGIPLTAESLSKARGLQLPTWWINNRMLIPEETNQLNTLGNTAHDQWVKERREVVAKYPIPPGTDPPDAYYQEKREARQHYFARLDEALVTVTRKALPRLLRKLAAAKKKKT